MAGEKSLERITGALTNAGKRSALATELGVSEGQLSKMLGGEIRRFCALTEILGLTIIPADYVTSMERVLQEKLRS